MLLNGKSNTWEVQDLSSLFEIETGTTPSTKDEKFWKDGNIDWLTPTDLSALENNIYVNSSERKVTEEAIQKTNLSMIPQNSIILSTRAPVGYVAITTKPFCFNQGCKALIGKDKDKTVPLFYYYYFLFIKEYLQSISGGSTFKELSKDSLKNLTIPFPEKREQKAIAEILSTVDEAIQKADEAIKKTERIKQGMMQKLLTEGIGHKEFKETKIGRIPKEWEMIPISKLGIVHTGKTPSSFDKSLWIGNIPFVTPGDITDSKYVTVTERTVSDKGASVATQLPRNSLMVVCIGSTIGKVALTSRKVITNQQINSLIINEDKFVPDFIYYTFLNAAKIFKAFAGTAAVPIINKTLFEKFQVPVSLNNEEQKRIGEILTCFDDKLLLLKNRKFKLERIKQGLMDDLLTGKKKVRIN